VTPVPATFFDILNASAGGYSSTQEFIVHILEKEAAKFDDATDEAEVQKQLRGLGYIE
jgi:hypothetical protein